MTNKYSPGDVVYLKESAAIGFLEPAKIHGAHLGQNGWMYSVNNAIMFGGATERRSNINTQTIYYTEDEFLLLGDALVLVEANAKAAYDRAKAQRQQFYPDNPTVG